MPTQSVCERRTQSGTADPLVPSRLVLNKAKNFVKVSQNPLVPGG